jgi:hypothetical protein
MVAFLTDPSKQLRQIVLEFNPLPSGFTPYEAMPLHPWAQYLGESGRSIGELRLTNRLEIFLLVKKPWPQEFPTTIAVTVMKTAARKKPGKIETRLSMAFMALLFIIGIGVVLRQSQMNPAVVALRPEFRQQLLSPNSDRPALIDTTGSGIVAYSPPERFIPETLYEKINGRADLYLSSGFVALDTQRFSLDRTSSNWVEVFVYDMGSPENAFSVFSMQRRTGARPDERVSNAYRTDNALFMTLASSYLEFIGSDASQQTHKTIGILARTFVKTHGGGQPAQPPGADLFPLSGAVPGTVQLIQANAFGFERLDQVYTREYQFEDTRLMAFVSQRPDADAAAALAADYRRALLSFGATVVDELDSLGNAVVMQFFDTYEIVFSQGRYLAGLHEADSLEAAKTQAQQLFDHLKAVDAN